MPIQIINSGVNLAREPTSTPTAVVFRDQYGSVSRTASIKPRSTRRASQQQQRRGSCADNIGGAWDDSKGRKASLFGARVVMGAVDGGLAGEGRNSASLCDMTSVFGLEVHRLKAETPSAEEQKTTRSRGSAMPTSRPGSCGDDFGDDSPRRGNDDILSPALPDAASDTKDGSDSPSRVLLARSGGGCHRPSPVHATLTERINQGNQLVKSVRAGRSLRLAICNSMKGALDLGLWAANHPQELARIQLASSVQNGAADADKAPITAGLKNTYSVSRVFRPHEPTSDGGESDDFDVGGCNTWKGSNGGEDPVKMLEDKLRAIEDQHQARRDWRTSLSRMSRMSTTASSKVGSDRGRVVATNGSRASGTLVSSNREGGNYGCSGRIALSKGLPKIARPWQGDVQGRGRKPRGSSGRKRDRQCAGVKVPRTARISPGLADAKTKSAIVREDKGPPLRESLLTPSIPGKSGGKRHASPRASQELGPQSGSRSNGRGAHAAPGSASAGRRSPRLPVLTSAEVKQALITAVRTFFLRAVALDDELTEAIRRKDFDWGMDMRRMIAAISVADVGKTTLESVPQIIRKQVLAKKRSDEKKSLRDSWFPSLIKRVCAPVGNEAAGAGMPVCMVKLAAALRKVLINGHTVTPPLFWSLVGAAFREEDHRSKAAQKMVLACLAFVRQRPEDYHRFLVDSSIAVPTSLRRVVARASGRQRRALSGRRGAGGQRKSVVAIRSSSRPIVDGDLAEYPDGKGVGSSTWGMTSRGDASDDLSDDLSETVSVNSCASRETGAMTR